MSIPQCSFSLNDIYVKLNQRVSAYNAKLLLNAAIVSSGVNGEKDDLLNVEDAKSLCLELIKKGGPAFQVGKDFYSQVQ